MTCIWRIHGSKPYIFRCSLVYNTSVFCFSHFHLEGWVGGLSQMKLTSFEKNCHILRRSLTIQDFSVIWIDFISSKFISFSNSDKISSCHDKGSIYESLSFQNHRHLISSKFTYNSTSILYQ